MSKLLISNIPSQDMEELGFTYSYLKDEDFDCLMKDLVLESNLEFSEVTLIPFVYMFDCSEEEMNTISNYFKSKNIQAVYAASTTHNLQWSLHDLLNEIMEEHRTFQVAASLKEWIQKTMKLPKSENSEWVEKTLMASFVAFQNRKLDEMEKMIEILKELHEEKA